MTAPTENRAATPAKPPGSRASALHEDERGDSWLDAVVTILSIVLFGLGWVLVELERAEDFENRYDAAIRTSWTAAVASSIRTRALEASPTGISRSAAHPIETVAIRRIDERGDRNQRWTALALRSARP